jgi:hypothetical protein
VVAQKGKANAAEAWIAERAITLLGGEPHRVLPVELPNGPSQSPPPSLHTIGQEGTALDRFVYPDTVQNPISNRQTPARRGVVLTGRLVLIPNG